MVSLPSALVSAQQTTDMTIRCSLPIVKDIISSLGYSSLDTLLMLTPGGATTMVSIYISAVFAVKVKNSRVYMLIFTCLFPIVGACMIWQGNWDNRAVPLAGYWLLAIFGAREPALASTSLFRIEADCTASSAYVMMLSLSTANMCATLPPEAECLAD